MSRRCKVSAPGKVILHGEHSVVYGKSAIAASLGIRTSVSIQERPQTKCINFLLRNLHPDKITFDSEDIEEHLLSKIDDIKPVWSDPDGVDHDRLVQVVTAYWTNYQAKNKFEFRETVSQAVAIALYLLCGLLKDLRGGECMSFDLEVTSDLTIGSGIGSSASYAVSVAAAFLTYLRICAADSYRSKLPNTSKDGFSEEEKKIVSGWAYCGEKISHGNPSGVDNTVCTYGNLVEFKKGHKSLHHTLRKPLKVCLVNTEVKRNTKALVEKVAKLKGQHPEIVDPILEALERIAQKALSVLQCMECADDSDTEIKHYEDLAELFVLNHNLLRTLGVSHPMLEIAANISHELNFSCKLTGAGGGGYAIVLIPSHANAEAVATLIENLNANKLKANIAYLGGDGVKIDEIVC